MTLHKLLGRRDDNPYLIFNDNREAMCGVHGCDHRARDVLGISREAKDASVAGSRLHIKVGNHYLWFGTARCGTHNRGKSHSQLWMQATLMTGYIDLDFDTLARAFSEKEERDRLRHEREEALYRKSQLEVALMAEDQFVVERGSHYNDGVEWVIKGPDYSGKPAVTSQVSITIDAGVAHVRTSDYAGHTGRGHGSPALARLIARLLVEAADIADERNKEVK
jgi:hypothetical protein